MSYIRMGQQGFYLNIPEGSNYYLYGNGDDIDGWDYDQFAGVLSECIPYVSEDDEEAKKMRAALKEEFGGITRDYKGGVAPPEKAEIFLQVLDRRTHVMEVDDDLVDRFEEWVESRGPYMVECENCGKEFRPYIRDGGDYYCDEGECSIAFDAAIYDISCEQAAELQEIDDMDKWEEKFKEFTGKE